MSELVVEGLVKSFGGPRVLDGLDLTVPEGALAAVLGSSGCGKTTLLRVVAGFEPADAGTIVLSGTKVASPGRHVPPERRRVGVVPQEGALFPHLTVAGNVGFGLGRGRKNAVRVDELLELVGLAGFGGRMPYELSGGQQQRVALARALAPGPALVLLDEPFSALDTGLRAAVREDVRTALRATGATAVLVTHDQEEALSMADLVAVMDRGRIAQVAAPGELYASPVDLGVATFVGDAVILDVVADGLLAASALGTLELREQMHGSGRVVVRPEQITLTDAGSGIPATVTATVFYGHDALVRVDVAGSDGPVPVSIRRLGAPTDVSIGESVGVRVVGPVSFYPAV
ncbi:MAG TPA: ABC transporter ATP-binding protein [Jiangellaceae bacterium]